MLRKLLPHAAIILSGMYFVFFFIDRVNSAMAFINNGITKRLLFILCVIVIIMAIWLIRDERNKVRREQARAAEARRRQQESARMRRGREERPYRHSSGEYAPRSRYGRY